MTVGEGGCQTRLEGRQRDADDDEKEEEEADGTHDGRGERRCGGGERCAMSEGKLELTTFERERGGGDTCAPLIG